MAVEINAVNACDAFVEGIWKIRQYGSLEPSRNGSVWSIPEPVVLCVDVPEERVLTCPERNANPFFHLLETVWMFAGSRNVDFVAGINGRMREYANDGIINGAYGHRWRYNFEVDQIVAVVDKLRRDPTTRQAVISMWDPNRDNERGCRDYPCNTHIYFRVVDCKLQMTVCNRSNDFVWGMLGSNIVHMTYLQELIAHYAGLSMGRYFVMTNNLHLYHEKHNSLLLYPPITCATYRNAKSHPLISAREWRSLPDYLRACERFIEDPSNIHAQAPDWIRGVVAPAWRAWQEYKNKNFASAGIITETIEAEDWRLACREWLERKISSSAT